LVIYLKIATALDHTAPEHPSPLSKRAVFTTARMRLVRATLAQDLMIYQQLDCCFRSRFFLLLPYRIKRFA
jgi:hypothetical protein